MRARLLLALLACSLIAGVSACGGDDDDAGPASTPSNQPSGQNTPTSDRKNDASANPSIALPASRFAISLDDVGSGYLTDLAATFVLDAENYGATNSFSSASEGKSLLEQWGYLGGFETGFEPETRYTGVLNGAFYFAVEVHVFKDVDGAKTAYTHFEQKVSSGPSKVVSAPAVGNQSTAWKLVHGKVPESPIDAAYHRVLFRRGNMVAIVQTFGADPLMTVNPAAELAGIMDDKAIGQRPAVEPTPIGGSR